MIGAQEAHLQCISSAKEYAGLMTCAALAQLFSK